jgi:hypothetical protein
LRSESARVNHRGLDTQRLLQIAGAIGLLIVGKYLDRWFTRKPKLISYIGHVSAFTLRTDPPKAVYTHAVVVINVGRLHATNVRIGHAVLPENYQVIPTSVSHRLEGTAGGPAEIILDRMVPGEQVTISYLYWPPLLWNNVNSYTKSDEGFAKIVSVLPTRQFSRWTMWALRTLVFSGAVSICYWVYELIRWVILR